MALACRNLGEDEFAELYNSNEFCLLSHLPDELCFRVYSYLRIERKQAFRRKETNFALDFLMLTQSLVSRSEYSRVRRYAQQNTQDFAYHGLPVDLHEISWACRNNVKIGSCDFTNCSSEVECNLFINLLKFCNIADMHTFRISMDEDSIFMLNWLLGKVIQADIPLLVNPELTFSDFQREMSNIIPSRTRSLEKLNINVRNGDMYIPFFTCFSQTLTELVLSVNECCAETKSEDPDDELKKVTNAIEHMPVLKKVTLNVSFPASFRLMSSSLEELDTIGSAAGFFVNECVCGELFEPCMSTKRIEME